MPLPITAILFDKDGTLVDFDKTWFKVLKELADTAANGDRDRADHLLDIAGFDWTVSRFRPGSAIAAGTIEDMIDIWHPELLLNERAETIRVYDARAVAEGARCAIPFDNLETTLKTLHQSGYILGVGTNDSEAGAMGTVEALMINGYFASVLGYNSVRRPKPFPDMLLHFANAHGLEPCEIAVVGDNTHDLEMARTAGAGLAIGVLTGTGTREVLGPYADVVLPSINELPLYLASR